jgi:hypothetical protein
MNTKGEGPVTLADAGKEITRESATVALRDNDVLQGRVMVNSLSVPAAVAVHMPAIDAVVCGDDQQVQEVHSEVERADEAQQQPPRHKLVPQSALEAQVSPGELSTQVPAPKWHAAQPCRAALGVQQ